MKIFVTYIKANWNKKQGIANKKLLSKQPAGWAVCSSGRTGWRFFARTAPLGGTPPRTGWSPWSGEGREWPWRRDGRATWGCQEDPRDPGRKGSWWWSTRRMSSTWSPCPRTWTWSKFEVVTSSVCLKMFFHLTCFFYR